MNKVIAMFAILFTAGFSLAYADDSEKESFASALEETLGHLHALELNLDDSKPDLATAHATHPIAELYDAMKPELQEHDKAFDAKFESALNGLADKTIGKPRNDAQKAIDEVKDLVEQARTIVVGEKLSSDSNFRLDLIKELVETAESEYEEAISDGKVKEMVEYQDGSAFVWRAQQIFYDIKADLPQDKASEIDEHMEELTSSIKKIASVTEVETHVDGVVHEIDEILGVESEEASLETYFDGIEHHLAEVKEMYAKGESDEALSHATKAYLDNYEFLEKPIAAQDKELMEDLEVMMREELRAMIKQGVSKDKVNSQIDSVLEKLEKAEELLSMDSNEAHDDDHGEEHNEKGRYAEHVTAPHKQIKSGIKAQDVQCGEYLELVLKKSTGTPACVKSETAEKLVKLGWGTRQ